MRNLLLSLLCLTGCSEYTISERLDQPAISPPEILSPEIDVVPGFVDFGVGDGTISEQLQSRVFISNIGDDDLIVTGLVLDEPFIGPAFEDVWLAPEDTIEVDLSYISVGDVTTLGVLKIHSNDEDEPETLVDLAANAIAPILFVEPESIDFGEVGITCLGEGFFTVGNTGRAPLRVEELSDSLFESFYVEFPDPEFVIGPNEVVEGVVGYTPLEPLSNVGEIVVTTDAWNTRHGEIEVSGTGVWGEEVVNEFEQVEVVNADVLFVIDNSCSMNDEQVTLASNAGLFMTALDATGVDYQVGVITTDTPSFTSPIITPATSDPVTEFELAVMVGTAGDAYERGLEMAKVATTSPADASSLAGFIRLTSILAVVVVSDEDDFSPSVITNYASHFSGLKTNPDEVAFHSVVDDGTTHCGDDGVRYMDTSILTGGLVFDLCTGTWGTFLESIVDEATTPVNTFELTEDPVPDTIVVTVSGAVVTDWDFYDSPPRIVFWQGSIPPSLSSISVTYNTWPECD